MGRSLDDVIAASTPSRRSRVEARYRNLKKDVERSIELQREATSAQPEITPADEAEGGQHPGA